MKVFQPKKFVVATLSFLIAILSSFSWGSAIENIVLPQPDTRGRLSVEEVLNTSRPRSEYGGAVLKLKDLSQLLWSTKITPNVWDGRITIDSARVEYPMEVYVVVGDVEGVKPGTYHYIPTTHSLVMTSKRDVRRDLAKATFDQKALARAPITIVISAFFSPTIRSYGIRGTRYVYIEAGRMGQNIYLQAEALNLSAGAVGAFDDRKVKEILGIKAEPLILYPVAGR